MSLRIIAAGLVGGLLIFITGAFNHMVLNFEARAMQPLPDEEAFKAVLSSQQVKHGIYPFPYHDEKTASVDQEKAYEKLNEIYKAGPNGLLIVGRTGEDMMSAHELGGEFGTNCFAALAIAWIVSRFAPQTRFFTRWLAVVLMGVAAWLSLSASQAIWYRFPGSFVHDELYGVLLESAVAGLAIAAIVRHKVSKEPQA